MVKVLLELFQVVILQIQNNFIKNKRIFELMKKINEITKGKAKSMFTTENDDHLIMHFSDDTSAFDGKKKSFIRKGSSK